MILHHQELHEMTWAPLETDMVLTEQTPQTQLPKLVLQSGQTLHWMARTYGVWLHHASKPRSQKALLATHSRGDQVGQNPSRIEGTDVVDPCWHGPCLLSTLTCDHKNFTKFEDTRAAQTRLDSKTLDCQLTDYDERLHGKTL